MKKSLFAIAAVTAFAGAAQAQSSVTVYGILDMGYVGYNTRVANGPTSTSVTPGAALSGTVNKTTGNAFSTSAESTSRLGFSSVQSPHQLIPIKTPPERPCLQKSLRVIACIEPSAESGTTESPLILSEGASIVCQACALSV